MKLAILIPAAGNSVRLGQPKQLVDFNGQPLLQNRLNLCTNFSKYIYCILGANGHQIRHAVINPHCRFLFNPLWQNGLGQSIAFGVAHLPSYIDAVMILLADQWALNSTDLQRLINAWQQQPDRIHASFYEDHLGVPVIFPSQHFQALAQMQTGDDGAKALLQQYQSEVVSVAMPNAADDLDQPEQLHQLYRVKLTNHLFTTPSDITEDHHDHTID